jgi:chemotaxis protein methyltransferase CheR
VVALWAAAGGQELYSVAILLDELKYLHGGAFDVQLFASDINEQQLQIARAGKYKYKDIEQMTEKRLSRYFNLLPGGHYVIDKDIVKAVTFNSFDLTDANCTCPPESVFGDFDLIICANVLIYYNNDHVDRIFRQNCKMHGQQSICNDRRKRARLCFTQTCFCRACATIGYFYSKVRM